MRVPHNSPALKYYNAPTQESMRPRGVVRKFRADRQQGSPTPQRDITKPAFSTTAPAREVSR